MQRIQEESYPSGFNYREGSPHLKHWHLFDTMVRRLRAVLADTAQRQIASTLLDVGAGEGTFVEPVLASGFSVTALEMSRPAIATMNDRYGGNPGFRAHFDEDGSLSVLGEQRFGVILYTSVLHHIPDYISALETAIGRHLQPGGSLVSFQDPLLYSSVSTFTRFVIQIAYFWWRLGQGKYRRGLMARQRRLRGVYDEENISDMSEYHVVRDGVDQDAIVALLTARFDEVSLLKYWSTQSQFWQGVGERLHLNSTFAIVASGFRG